MNEYRGNVLEKDEKGSILCISPEAKDLLERLVKRYQAQMDYYDSEKTIHDIDGYEALNWAVRWSNLIQPFHLCKESVKT